MSAATATNPTKLIDPAQVADEATSWAKGLIENLSDGFVALYLYGSAVDPGFDPVHSDVNLLLVAEALPASTIRKLSENFPGRGPMGSPANVVAMSADQITRAADTFALELSEVRHRGRLLAGNDILAGVEIPNDSLRHHLERELRVLSVTLRRVYLEGRDNQKALTTAMCEAIGTVVACARGIAYLRGSTLPLTAESALKNAAEWAGIEDRPWVEAWHLRHESVPQTAVDSIYLDFLDAVTTLMRKVDTHTEDE
jgi:hypothetical protein